MPRIESTGSQPLSTDAVPDAAPPSSTARAKPAPRPASRNEVRAYDGSPATASRSASPSAPRDAGPTVSAGELAALGGRMRPAAPEVPADVYADIRAHLTHSWDNLLITDSDLKSVQGSLEKLPPATYRAALEQMERDGLLRTFLNRLDVGTRWEFLEQTERKGVVRRERGDPVTGPCEPPSSPDLFVNDSRLPLSLSEAVTDSCADAANAYYAAYGHYIERYQERVEKAASGAELRALGPPKSVHLPEAQPGLVASHPEYQRLISRWNEGTSQGLAYASDAIHAHVAVNRRIAELTGEKNPGTFWLSVEGEAHLGAVKVGREVKLRTDGRADTAIKGGMELGGEVHGAGVKFSAEKNTRGESKTVTEAELGGFGIATGSDGEMELKAKLGKTGGVYAKANPAEGEAEGGFSIGVDGESAGFEVKVGVGEKLLPQEVARRALDPKFPGPFGMPSELKKGVPWERLSPERQALFRSQDWTPEEWKQRLGR